MKKTYRLFGAVLFLTSLVFTSCFNPIFYEIRKDVEPEEATVNGPISSIARYTVGDKEFLVLAAGTLKYKPVSKESHGEWIDYGAMPFDVIKYNYDSSSHDGEYILKVLTDSDYIYLITATYTQDEGASLGDYISVWTKKITLNSSNHWSEDGKWERIVKDTDETYFPLYITNQDIQTSAFSVFHTNAPQKENRQAYIRSGNAYVPSYKDVKYYQLTNGKIVAIDTPTVQDSKTSNAASAVVMNGQTYFFNSYASTTNETFKNPATVIYYGDDSTLCYSSFDENNTMKFKSACDTGRTIVTLATCKDSILMGCAEYYSSSTSSIGGIYRTILNNGIPLNRTVSFTTNADFQLGSSYHINVLLNSTPDRDEEDSAIYAAIGYKGTSSNAGVSPKNQGLWSYYAERGNWNRE